MSKKPVIKVEKIIKARQYECMLIIENTVGDEPRAKLVEKFCLMTGDKSIKVDKWGLKKFATPINHKKDGYYFLLHFKSMPDVPRKMAELMNITDGIVRFMFVCKDDQKVHKSKPSAKKKIKKEPKES